MVVLLPVLIARYARCSSASFCLVVKILCLMHFFLSFYVSYGVLSVSKPSLERKLILARYVLFDVASALNDKQ